MAEFKLTEIAEASNVAATDYIDVSKDIGGGLYVSRKVTWSNASSELLTSSNAISIYVPYSGATGTVNLGSNSLTTTGEITGEMAKVQNTAPTTTNGNLWLDTTDPSTELIGSASFNIDQSGGTNDSYGILSGTINSSNTIFTVSQSIYVTGTLKVYLNGQLQTQGNSEDWVETSPSAGTFTFITAPTTGSQITVTYQKLMTTSGNADTVDGIHASSSPTANILLPLNANGAIDVKSTYIENTTSNEDLLIKINDGGVTRTAILVNGDEGSVTMPRQSYVRASCNNSQVISTATFTKVQFNSEAVDTLGEFDPSTNYRFTAIDAGKYTVYSNLYYTTSMTTTVYIIIRVNGSNVFGVNDPALVNNRGISVGATVTLSAGDYVEIFTYQGSGSDKTLGNDGLFNYLTIVKVA